MESELIAVAGALLAGGVAAFGLVRRRRRAKQPEPVVVAKALDETPAVEAPEQEELARLREEIAVLRAQLKASPWRQRRSEFIARARGNLVLVEHRLTGEESLA